MSVSLCVCVCVCVFAAGFPGQVCCPLDTHPTQSPSQPRCLPPAPVFLRYPTVLGGAHWAALLLFPISPKKFEG